MKELSENKVFTSRQRNTFEQICKLGQEGVLSMMRSFLIRRYGKENVIATKDFIVAKGEIPVGLVAHADTVFSRRPSEFYYDKEANVMWSPDGMGADDRAGIFSIIQIINGRFKPHIIITTDEESGCIGAMMLVKKYKSHPFNDLKFLIQLDRRGEKDSVYYDCANDDFEQFINQFGFDTAYGTLSDISALAPVWGVAAVNLSIGYIDEHSHEERLFVSAMWDTIEKVKKILTHVQEHEVPKYEYIEDTTARYFRKYSYSTGWKDYDDSWWDDGYNLTKKSNRCQCSFCGDVEDKTLMLEIFYKPNYAIDLCNECYSQYYENVEWCFKCGLGWYLTQEEKDEITKNGDRMHWICRNCKEEHKDGDGEGNSEASESCNPVVARLRSLNDEHRRTDEGLERIEIEIPDTYDYAGL